ncbi:hypothetical protein O0I10_010944 [Lichtheimia ornata]|uniref:DNA topoisomerase (ATP-hydrolyzing) n=1 Tax=Lichtheimia ornata TaxID=688661 RepID=A0AAD7UUJ0_9FUNG|nr:uncharacterized protein O0I10_010944 [Lichtheimia ornata]KAJ8653398.1 hypothetical protein O0I10_010944 [Lichtheimia ornata]
MDDYLDDLCTSSYLDDYDDLFSQQDQTQRQSTTSALLNHHVDSQQVIVDDSFFDMFSSSQLPAPSMSSNNDDTTTTTTAMIATKRPAIMDDPPHQSSSTNTGTQPKPRESVIASIEETILSVVQRMALGKSLELPGFGRPQPNRTNKKQKKTRDHAALQQQQRTTSLDLDTNSLEEMRSTQPSSSSSNTTSSSSNASSSTAATSSSSTTRALTLNSAASAKTFARYLRVLEIIHEALVTSVVVSKRDIYYRDIALFGTQSVVDKIVDDLSCFYNVPRSNLNVTAASKGLVFGPAKITLKNGKVIDCSTRGGDGEMNQDLDTDDQGVLIPPANHVAHMEWEADFLLIIEKEASFRHLVASGFSTMFPTAMLITDLATRHMVKYMSAQDRTLPIIALVDCDPYGLDIYSVYKWGSQAQAFDSPNLAVPSIQFLGLSMQDRSRFGIPHSAYAPLTVRDRRKAMLLLQNSTNHASSSSTEGSSQDHQQFVNLLSSMVHMDKKCELQGLCANHEFGMLKLLQAKLVHFILEA